MYLPPKVTRRAFERLSEINAANEGKALRIAVEGGGCSGFQYEISLGNPTAEDLIIEEGEQKVQHARCSEWWADLAKPMIRSSPNLLGKQISIDKHDVSYRSQYG